MRVGEVLKKWRIMSDLDLQTVANELGISSKILSNLERGTVPNGIVCGRIIAWLFSQPVSANGSNPQKGPESVGKESSDAVAAGSR